LRWDENVPLIKEKEPDIKILVATIQYQNLLSPRLLSKNVKIGIYKTLILPVILYGYEIWSLTLREEHRLKGV
jgi:hypothetical protein